MTKIHPKRVMFAYMASMAGALSHPSRVEMLDLLAQGRRSVESIAAATCLSVSNASQHLRQLQRAGILSSTRDGKQMFYALADDEVIELFRSLRSFTERHSAEAEISLMRLYKSRDAVTPVTRDELVHRLETGSTLLLDVRPELEYAAGHIPGAVNIPVDRLADCLADIPKDQDIVAYCRGPYCVFAYEAMEILRPAGRNARRLLGGFFEWRGARMPIVTNGPQSTLAAQPV